MPNEPYHINDEDKCPFCESPLWFDYENRMWRCPKWDAGQDDCGLHVAFGRVQALVLEAKA